MPKLEALKPRGMSLIETVVAITMLALATIVAVASLPATTALSNKGRNRVAAAELAQATLEEHRAKPFSVLPAPPADVSLGKSLLEGTGIEFTRKLRVSAVSGYSPQQLRRVTVTVTWRERGALQTVHHEATFLKLPR
jgi:Tfp pilus assembly protein PilV